jgi:hypothetical protein
MTAPTDNSQQGWQPIETAPKDGTVILLAAFDADGTPFGEEWPCYWGHIQQNGLFPGVTGMWTVTGGGVTWSEAPEEGGPTHWRPLPPAPGEGE